MSTNHGLRSAEIAQTGHFSFDKSMKHILGIEESAHLLIWFHNMWFRIQYNNDTQQDLISL